MPSIDVDELTRRKIRVYTRVLHNSCKTGYYSTHFNIYCTTLLKKITCIILTIKLSVCVRIVRVYTLKCQMFEKCLYFLYLYKKIVRAVLVPSTKYTKVPLLPPPLSLTSEQCGRLCHCLHHPHRTENVSRKYSFFGGTSKPHF